MELIERFLREAPDHLEQDGEILLLIESGELGGRNAVVERIAAALAANGLAAERQIRSTYGRGGEPPALGVTSVLRIRRDPRQPGAIRTRSDLGRLRAAVRRGVLRIAGR